MFDLFDTENTPDPTREINKRLVGCISLGKGLFGYVLYVEGERVKDLVLDETLTESEVNELRQLTVDLRYHPNRVFLH